MKNLITKGYPKEMIVINGIGEKQRVIVLCEYKQSKYPYKTINKNGVLDGYEEVFELPKIKRVPLEPSIDMLNWKLRDKNGVEDCEIVGICKDRLFLKDETYNTFESLMKAGFEYQPKYSNEWFPCYKEIEE